MTTELIAQVRELLNRVIPGAINMGWISDAEASALRQVPTALEAQQAGGEPVHQYRKQRCANWYDGHPDHLDGGGPYETRVLYTHPAPVQQGDALRAALEDLTHQVDWFVQEQGSHGFCTQQAHAALAAQPAAERVPFDPLAEFGFMLEQRRDVWVVVDDCGGTTPASLTERVMWDAIVKSRGITATSGKESGND